MRILEVGPSFSPIAPKSEGWDCFVLDHASQSELREKYSSVAVPVEDIEAVDFVWQAGPIDASIPAHLAAVLTRALRATPSSICQTRSPSFKPLNAC
jgi:hypothetical protein